MPQQNSINVLKNPSKQSFFVLDIDSTLVTTHQRNQRILFEWINHHSSEFPDDCTILRQAQTQFGDYGLKSALDRIQFKEQNPGASDSLNEFWRKNFFSNTYLSEDIAVRGAVHWTQNLEELGIEFIYLTARHKPTMWEGTLSSLDQLGFPIDESILFLKEDLSLSDEAYKASLLNEIIASKKGKDIWLIDNEPVVLHEVMKHHPTVNLVWFDSTHSGKMQPPPEALKINHFNFERMEA